MGMGPDGNPEWLLEVSDSIVTYRSRYMARPEWIAVLDLLVADEANPRGIVFQTAGLKDYLLRLDESIEGGMPDTGIVGLHRRMQELDPERDFRADSPALREVLMTLRWATADLSDQIGQHFFSHSDGSVRVIS